MKTLVVTSQVTFVPENYGRLVGGIAELPEVGGLLILDNLDSSLVAKALSLVVSGIAPRLGLSLLKNSYASFKDSREEAFRRAGKPVYRRDSINDPEVVNIVREGGYDLILNARTRFIYKKEILTAPAFGCINIHHGLLPDQRGVFCDMWALSEGRQAGFSVHRMTEKLDDGEILSCVSVSDGSDRDFLAYTLKSSERECREVGEILRKLSQDPSTFASVANQRTPKTRYFKNPSSRQVCMIRKAGLAI